ncbi:hypothetical protein ACQPZJ_22260 [Actinoplanes sp. CA-054009]
MFHSLLGAVRLARFRLRRHRPSLDRAISHLERAVAGRPRDHADRALELAALSNGLLWRYELTSAPADLDRAVAVLREAIATPGLRPEDRATCHSDLAGVLRSRYILYGTASDLDDAIDAATDAMECSGDTTAAVTNRALALVARYERTAHVDDLLAALRDARRPVTGGPVAVALHRSFRLVALTDALGSLYQYTDDPGDLTAAIEAGRQLTRPETRFALSALLCLSGRPGDLEESVAVAEAALRETPADHADRVVMVSTLSMALFMRHLVTEGEGEGDLRKARERAEEAYAIGSPSARPVLLQRLSVITRRWLARTSDVEALERAGRLLRAGLGSLPAGHPLRGALTCELAELVLLHPDRATRRSEATRLLVEAVGQGSTASSTRNALRAAGRLGELAAETGDVTNARLGYRRAVELLPTAAWPGLRRAIREARLAEAPRATDAAAQALAGDDERGAVELLESGRSVLWSQQLDLRTDLTRLRATAPELEGRLNAIRGWFERDATATYRGQ